MSRSADSVAAAKTAAAPRTARSTAARHRIDDEHRQLGTLLRAMVHTRDLQRLAQELAALRALLVSHFAGEEGADGLHQVVGEGASHRLSALQQLFEEHRLLLAKLDELQAETAAVLTGPVRRVHEQVAWLADTLHRHEKQEEALFGEAFYTDLGRT